LAIACISIADVIVVGSQQDEFVPKLRVGSRKNSQDVAAAALKNLKVPGVTGARLQMVLEIPDQVVAGRIPASAACFPPL
jgi:hypothetical protein